LRVAGVFVAFMDTERRCEPVPRRRNVFTTKQKELVQASFASLQVGTEGVAALFYTHLFRLDASLRAMFTGDQVAQRKKLGQMLATVVKGLDRPEQLMLVVRELGWRHASYGVTEAHFDTVGTALLLTLEEGLGAAFTADVAAGWGAVYGFLAETMKEGLRAAHVPGYQGELAGAGEFSYRDGC
jgi:hemoglobin-like flavoprotein